jgi:hypothetical protein
MAVLVYSIVGLLTFGWRWNRPSPSDEGVTWAIAFLAGIFWPFYWPGCASIFLMKPKERL